MVALLGSTLVRVMLADGAMVKVVSCGPDSCGWLWQCVVTGVRCMVRVMILPDYVVGPCSARVGSPAWSPMRACKKLRSIWRRGDMEGLVVCRPSGAW